LKILAVEKLECNGHVNVLGEHPTTIEMTKDSDLTLQGDCIIGVKATKALKDFNKDFKRLAKEERYIQCNLRIEDREVVITGKGDPNLSYAHPTDIVIRKSFFTCPRTVMIWADKAAKDLPRDFIQLLKNPDTRLECEFTILELL